MVANDSSENRGRNRRVEIVIEQGADDEKYLTGKEQLPEDPEFTPELLKQAGIEDLEGFEVLSGDQVDAQTQQAKDVISVLDPEAAPTEAPNPAPPADSGTAPFDLSVDPFAPEQPKRQQEEFF
jgi:hypothetical protein